MIWTKKFWRATAERAAKTGAQSAILAVAADQVNAFSLDWAGVAGFAAGGVVLSVLTSVASSTVAGDGPSLGTEQLPGA